MKTSSVALVAMLAVPWSSMRAADQQPLIHNARVTVWDVAAGSPTPAAAPSRDVVIFVIRGTAPDVQTDVLYRARGAAVPAPADARRIVIELQDTPVPPLANTSGYPPAFPRPGSRKLLENDRVVVWTSTWTMGVATPMHFHDKDVVVTFLADGTLASTDAQGKTTANERHFGDTSFNPRARLHTERLDRGQGRAMMVELKP